MSGDRPVRIALLAGTLGQGGAEKQLVYLARALRDEGAEVLVLSLTRGELHERSLRAVGIDPVWVGARRGAPSRLLAIASHLRRFRPHVLQAAHFYANLYVRLAAPSVGALGIGTARNDVVHEVGANGAWGPWLLRLPTALIVNSYAARENAVAAGRHPGHVRVLPNVIDVAAFDEAARRTGQREVAARTATRAVIVGSLEPRKRVDRFVRAIAAARASGAAIEGTVVGDGSAEPSLRSLAAELGLSSGEVRFVGRRDDVPALLAAADVLVMTSDHEGFPNTLLEAMAARLPVVATDAGDAPRIVVHEETGFVVPRSDPDALAAALVTLASSADLRVCFGAAARARVERCYDVRGLGARALRVLLDTAVEVSHQRALPALRAAVG